MTDSKPSDPDPNADDAPDRPPRYEQVFRWAEYINNNPPEVWGRQQNAVVNGQIESARAVEVNAEDRARIRAFADAELGRDGETNKSEPE